MHSLCDRCVRRDNSCPIEPAKPVNGCAEFLADYRKGLSFAPTRDPITGVELAAKHLAAEGEGGN